MKKSTKNNGKPEEIQDQFSRLESLSQSFAQKIEEIKREQDAFTEQMKKDNLFHG